MRGGQLRERVTIEQQAKTPNGRGGHTLGEWGAVAGMSRIPAMVKPLGGDERIAAMQAQSGVTHEVVLRYRMGIKADMRAVWHAREQNRVLYLTSAPVITGKHQGLRFMVREDAD